MGFFGKQLEKIELAAKEELSKLLISNEDIQFFSMAKEDYFAITNKRVVFIDRSKTSSKRAVTGVPFSKISSVSLKMGGTFSLSKEVILMVGSKELEIDMYESEKALEFFKMVSERIG